MKAVGEGIPMRYHGGIPFGALGDIPTGAKQSILLALARWVYQTGPQGIPLSDRLVRIRPRYTGSGRHWYTCEVPQ